jgi:pimeloyl-ACP methyl ester carboxylesterase
LRVIRLVALLVVVLLLAVFMLQRRVLFPRPPAPSIPPPIPEGGEVLRLGEDAVEAWLLPPIGTGDHGEAAPVIVFTHGNGELIDHWLPAFDEPRRWGFAVLLVEYPGYGRSGGSPSQASITDTMLAAHDALAARSDIDLSRLVAYGRSLGGGAACALAAQRDVAALMLESTFTSVRAMASTLGLPGALVLDPFDNEAVLEDYDGPVLILHGEQDRIVPVSHGERLAEVTRTELVRLPCGHNDCPRPWSTMREFLGLQGLLP